MSNNRQCNGETMWVSTCRSTALIIFFYFTLSSTSTLRVDISLIITLFVVCCSMIEKCDRKNLYFKTQNLKITHPSFQYIFVLEQILCPATISHPEETEERELLFGFAKKEKEFTCTELFRIIRSIYSILSANYCDWVYDD